MTINAPTPLSNMSSHPDPATEDEKPRTLFVGNIPQGVSKREIETIFGELGPLKRCFLQYPRNDGRNESNTTISYVTFALPEDATSALDKLGNHKLGDNKLLLKFAKSRTEQQREQIVKYKGPRYQGNQPKEPDSAVSAPKAPREKQVKKKARLIIRNLAFQATEEKLSKYFSKYGKIKEVNLLRKANGKLVGCAFIQFGSANQAAKVVKELNLKPFMGRPIAIDWALPKTKFQESNEDSTKVKEEETEQKEDTKDVDDEVKIKPEPEDTGYDYFSSSVTFNVKGKGTTTTKRKKSSESEEDDDDDNQSIDSDSDPDSKPPIPKQRKLNPNDADEGRTLFIRNLDFDVTSEKLSEFFEEFGPVNYSVLCKDKLTEHPKGTAFVKFRKPEDVTKCLDKFQEEPEHFLLGQRQFYISIAMTKEKLSGKLDTTKEEKESKSDKRNLFLVREGFIRPGTPAADGISASDLNKRASLYHLKKQMLKDLKIFVSDKRLCVHNLPPNYTDQQLRKLFKKYGGAGAKVTEARIMRNLADIDLKGLGKSKEYAFVTFTEHEHALRALRSLNNNPKIFTVNKRPIVEFSLENLAAIRAKEKRTEKSRENLNPTTSNKKDKQKNKNQKSTKEETVDGDNDEDDETSLPSFSGLTAKPGVSSLPSMKPKGKITRRNLKQNSKLKQKKKQQERRKREPKTRPKFNRSADDKVDKIVNRYKEKSGMSKDKDKKIKKKKKWFE